MSKIVPLQTDKRLPSGNLWVKAYQNIENNWFHYGTLRCTICYTY